MLQYTNKAVKLDSTPAVQGSCLMSLGRPPPMLTLSRCLYPCPYVMTEIHDNIAGVSNTSASAYQGNRQANCMHGCVNFAAYGTYSITELQREVDIRSKATISIAPIANPYQLYRVTSAFDVTMSWVNFLQSPWTILADNSVLHHHTNTLAEKGQEIIESIATWLQALCFHRNLPLHTTADKAPPGHFVLTGRVRALSLMTLLMCITTPLESHNAFLTKAISKLLVWVFAKVIHQVGMFLLKVFLRDDAIANQFTYLYCVLQGCFKGELVMVSPSFVA